MGRLQDQLFAHVFQCAIFLNQYSQFFALDLFFFSLLFFLFFFSPIKRRGGRGGVQAVTELLSGWLGVSCLFDSV